MEHGTKWRCWLGNHWKNLLGFDKMLSFWQQSLRHLANIGLLYVTFSLIMGCPSWMWTRCRAHCKDGDTSGTGVCGAARVTIS